MKYRLKKPAATVEAFQMTKLHASECRKTAIERDFSRWPDWLVKARGKMTSDRGAAWLDHEGTFRVHTSDGQYIAVRWGDYIVRGDGDDLAVWQRPVFEHRYEAAPE